VSIAFPLALSRPRARFACDPSSHRGRLFPQAPASYRTEFQRDRDRIVHASAFRRLKHKTQVFVAHEGDHYRTRLTHSLEVAQIARTLARALGLDEDLTEALALAHDLGHTAFGHAGEDALAECMAPYQGFDHNAQTLRLLTLLEQPYPLFDGLNLTWETLEGVVKHNGPMLGAIPFGIADYVARHDLELTTYASAEAQAAAIADDIAYDNHDIDDGLRAGLFGLEDVLSVGLVAEHHAAARAAYPLAPEDRLTRETIRRLIGAMVSDVLAESQRRLSALAPDSAQAIRRAPAPVIAFSDIMAARELELKAFLSARMYRHRYVLAKADAARAVVKRLFQAYLADAAALPPSWRSPAGSADQPRRIADFIAGMTDHYAISEHVRLFGQAPEGLLVL
jgi:dGTPase